MKTKFLFPTLLITLSTSFTLLAQWTSLSSNISASSSVLAGVYPVNENLIWGFNWDYNYALVQEVTHTIDGEAIWQTENLYVNDDATGANNGSSWSDAFTDLQSALAIAEEDDQIWVAEGTYLPGNSSTATYLINKNLQLYGGFAGTENSLAERGDPAEHPTILSGDVNGNDVVDDFVNFKADNVMVVVTIHANLSNETVVVDGFTIQGGHADNDDGNSKNGGGMHIGGPAKIAHCRFEQNFALNRGGAIATKAGTSQTITIDDCSFNHNLSNRGGAADIRFSNLYFTNCTFSENIALATLNQPFEQNGAAIMTQNSNCYFKRCTFDANEATNGAAALFFWVDLNGEGFEVEVDSCTFTNNIARTGAAFYSQTFGKNSLTRITHSTFLNNQSNGQTPHGNIAIYHQLDDAYGKAVIENCHFDGNTSNHTGGGLSIGSGPGAAHSKYSIKSCTFKNNTASDNAGALELWAEVNTDPSFEILDCVFEGNEAGAYGGGLSITTGSDDFFAVFGRCKFVGNKSDFGAAVSSKPDLITPSVPTWALVKFDNCLFTANAEGLAVISVSDMLGFELLNCTVVDNNVGSILMETISSFTLQNTILANPGHTEFTDVGNSTIISNGGNLILDNSLNDAMTPLDKPETAPEFISDNYQPSVTSPLVNAGVNDGVKATIDLAGNERIQQGTVDIGAYESPFFSTAIQEVFAGELVLSPNPASDFLNIQFPEIVSGQLEATFFDTQGKLVRSFDYVDGQVVDLQELIPGAYMLKVVDKQKAYVGKVVKQ
jgi:predicted outer membrane repeat protein